jgi:DHA1 family multidrug resistance protein-like MFS transporter
VEEKLEEDKADEEKSSSPSPPEPHEGGIHDGIEASRYDTRAHTAPFSHERFEIEAETAVERTLSRPIEPQRTKDGMILVDWYSTDDAANPQNWSLRKKTFAAVQIWYGSRASLCRKTSVG